MYSILLGKFKESIIKFQNAIKIDISNLGEDHPDVANNYNNIGLSSSKQGKYEEAIKNY